MRFLSFDSNGLSTVGVVLDSKSDQFVDLSMLGTSLPCELGALIATPNGLQSAHAAAKSAPANAIKSIKSAHLLPLITHPSKIVCMGLNYADHAKEGGNAERDWVRRPVVAAHEAPTDRRQRGTLGEKVGRHLADKGARR